MLKIRWQWKFLLTPKTFSLKSVFFFFSFCVLIWFWIQINFSCVAFCNSYNARICLPCFTNMDSTFVHVLDRLTIVSLSSGEIREVGEVECWTSNGVMGEVKCWTFTGVVECCRSTSNGVMGVVERWMFAGVIERCRSTSNRMMGVVERRMLAGVIERCRSTSNGVVKSSGFPYS